MKRWLIVGLALLAILPTFAVAATADHGRRLAGPFCIGKRDAPLPYPGVVRSIAVTQRCRSYEIRKFGLAIRLPDGSVAGPQGTAGPQGVPGSQGATGATGNKGDKGDRGKQGDRGPQGVPGIAGPKGDKGDKGDPGVGTPGPKGDKGDPGQKGDKGDPGDLSGVGTLTVCVTGGGSGGVTAGACHGNGDTWKLYGEKQ